MIKDPETPENICITVELEDGTLHEKCDTTSQPLGQDGLRIVAVWVDGMVRIYPLERVKAITLHFGQNG